MTQDDRDGDPYEVGLEAGPANYSALSPVRFLDRAAAVYPDRPAVVYGAGEMSYRDFAGRCRRLAAALAARGVGPGDTVSVMAPNIPEMLECHYGVPMSGAVLNAINIRLDTGTVAFILEHANTKVLIVDREYAPVVNPALAQMAAPPLVVDIDQAKRDAGLAAGAAEAFDGGDLAAAKAVRKMTDGGVAAVIDFVGSDSSFAFANAAVGRGGRIVVVGLIGGSMSMPLPMFPLRSLTIKGSFVGSLEQFSAMMSLVRDGKVSPIPIETRPLDDAEKSLQDLRAGRLIGRVVLQP